MEKLTHVEETGQSHMVDVGAKPVTNRETVATGRIVMQPDTPVECKNIIHSKSHLVIL